MGLTKTDILAALPKLSQVDLVAIQVMAASLLKGRTAALPAGAGLVHQTTLNALLATVGATQGAPKALLTKFNAKLPGLTRFLDENFPGWGKNRVTQEAFLRMLFGLLHDNIKSIGLTPSLGVMINHLGRMHEVVEDAFPNYLASGMGPVILKRFQ